MNLESALSAVFSKRPNGCEGTPSTPEGKFLALVLCWITEEKGPELPDKKSLYASAHISSHLGARAYQELLRCQWIQARRFEPTVSREGRARRHIDVIRHVLVGSQDQIYGRGEQEQLKGLSVKNRLLLVSLLDRAEFSGKVGPISIGDLAQMTGLGANQIKVQLQKLKELGLVSGVVPGATGGAVFGKVKSYIYLNFLHMYWCDFFLDLSAVCLDASLWQRIMKDESESLYRLMGDSSLDELVRRPELGSYFRNAMLMLISDILSLHWHDLRLNNAVSILQMGRGVILKFLKAQVPASNVDILLTVVASIASQIQTLLCKNEKGLMTRIGLENWHFCVLPQFGVHPQSMVVLTNCPHFPNRLDVNWLRTCSHDFWIMSGLMTSPDDAPLKLRSRRPGVV